MLIKAYEGSFVGLILESLHTNHENKIDHTLSRLDILLHWSHPEPEFCSWLAPRSSGVGKIDEDTQFVMNCLILRTKTR